MRMGALSGEGAASAYTVDEGALPMSFFYPFFDPWRPRA